MVSFIKGLAIFVVAVILILLVSYWAAGQARPELDEAARTRHITQGQAHQFIDTPTGTIHYRLEGPEDGRLIVLVHGFSTPSFVWNDYFKLLTEAGYRVLAYDNFGRGFSSRPKTVYDTKLFDQQLLDLLDALGIKRQVDLVGYSMGGAIATIFASQHPDKVRSLTLIAPAGLEIAKNETIETLLRPVVGDWIIRMFGTRIFYNVAAKESVYAPNPGIFLENFNRQLEYRGYGEALLSTLRHYPLADAEEHYVRNGQSGRPILVIWGEDDEITPYSGSKKLLEFMPDAQLRSYSSVGHAITFSQPDIVSKLMLGFLKTQDARVTSPGMGGKQRGTLSRMEARKCASCGQGSDEGDISTAPSKD